MGDFWTGIFVSAPAAGFILGHVEGHRARWLSYGALLLAPAVALTAGLALVAPAPPTFMVWWSAGFAMSSPVVAVWATLTTLGFAAARLSLR